VSCSIRRSQPSRSSRRRGAAAIRPQAWGALCAGVAVGLLSPVQTLSAAPTVVPVQTFTSPQAVDQDDMCLWVHPQDPALSLVIGSDKAAGYVLVYDLEGNLRQSIHTGQPGNIDVRYGIPLAGQCVDLVAFNERDERLIRVYRVDPSTRTLVRVDDGAITTGSNYGFTLHRPMEGSLYATTGSGILRQYLLFENATGGISGTATGWSLERGTVEGMVGDDETGFVYLSEEAVGIWKVSAFDDSLATLIAQAGDSSGLWSDVEGITIHYAPLGGGSIIASSQGASRFTVFDRLPPHAPVGNFQLDDVTSTDGIDVLNMSLNGVFTAGIFLAHDGGNPSTMVAAKWEDIVAVVPGMQNDPQYWDPRACQTSSTTPPRGAAPVARAVLHPNSPNPVNPSTRIRFTLQENSAVRLAVHDLQGRRLALLADGVHAAGTHSIEWRAADAQGTKLPSGVYVCRLEASGVQASIKLVVAK